MSGLAWLLVAMAVLAAADASFGEAVLYMVGAAVVVWLVASGVRYAPPWRRGRWWR